VRSRKNVCYSTSNTKHCGAYRASHLSAIPNSNEIQRFRNPITVKPTRTQRCRKPYCVGDNSQAPHSGQGCAGSCTGRSAAPIRGFPTTKPTSSVAWPAAQDLGSLSHNTTHNVEVPYIALDVCFGRSICCHPQHPIACNVSHVMQLWCPDIFECFEHACSAVVE
jgi:hypothetical protein